MFPIVFGSIFVLTGALPIWLAMKAFAKDRAIAKWPRAPGKVTSSSIVASTSSARDSQGFVQRYTVYEPQVSFTYTVAGRELHGNQVQRVLVRSSTKPDISPYPAGQDVMVFYDPSDPTVAYLEVHRSLGAVILMCFGGVFVFIGVLVPVLVLSCGA